MMADDLLSGEFLRVKCTVSIRHQHDLVAHAESTPCRRIDTHVRLNSCDIQLLDAQTGQFFMENRFEKGIRRMFLYDKVGRKRRNLRVNLPRVRSVFELLSFWFVMLDVDNGNILLA